MISAFSGELLMFVIVDLFLTCSMWICLLF